MNQNTITHASVFSGIGGPEVAAVMLGWENLFHCEINPFGKAVLDYWFPNSKSYEDITKTDFTEWRGKVTVLTGGFPCQPFSYAGRRAGAEDDRYLWPYMFRCIDQIQPDWVVAENVAGILTMVEQGEVSQVASSADLFDTGNDIRGYRLRETFTLQRICDDLESHGYTVQPVLIPACAVGAPHRRDRVFIIGRRNNVPRNSDDLGGRLSEREVREGQDTIAEGVRTVNSSATVSQDPVCGGQLVGHDGEQGSERNERNAGARDSERVCRETSRTASADTVGSGAGASRKSGCAQGNGSDTDQQPSQRRATTEWSDRFYAILRHATDTDGKGREEPQQPGRRAYSSQEGAGMDNRTERPCGNGYVTHADSEMLEGRQRSGAQGHGQSADGSVRHLCGNSDVPGARWQGFPTISPVHRGNDGLPFDVDDLTLPFAKWRTEALKAYGNAIVPQVMYEIFRAIDQIERN